ncbi:hypothetical protein JCM11491_000678 [Sporobolomyces phaffii]
MTIDDIVALIVGTDYDDVKETLLPALKKAEQQQTASGKGKGKDATPPPPQPDAGDGAASNAAAAGPAPPAGHVLAGTLQDGRDPLDALRPEQHCVGYLYILNAKLAAQDADLTKLMPKVMDWAHNFDPIQGRIVLEQVNQLLGRLHHASQAIKDYQIYLGPLQLVTQRWAPAGTLTSFHPLFLRTVFHYRAYHAAREILYIDITDVDKTTFPIKYQDHLLYHYLGGTILALLGDYVRASDLLEICVSAPGSAVSLIQLDAYKKLVLVQLLAYGKTLPLPKYTTPPAQNAYKSLLGVYNEYVGAFASLDKTKLFSAREKGRDVFTRDHNLGLVHLVEQSLRRRVIQKLTSTWSTLSLGQLTKLVGMDDRVDAQVEDVEREIARMVESRDLFATISADPTGPRSSKIVTFSDDPEPYLSHDTVKRVTEAIERAKRLEAVWSEEGDKMEEGKEFVAKMHQTLASGGGAGLPPPLGFADEFDYGSIGGFGRGQGETSGGDIDFVDDASFSDDGDDMD